MQYRTTILARLIVGSTLCCGTVARAAIIEFKDRAVVDASGVVQLSDVARIVESDSVKREQLERVTLLPAPAAGRTVRMTYDEVRQRLLAQGVNLAEIEVRGRSQVTVVASETQLASAARSDGAKQLVKSAAYTVSEPEASTQQQRRAREILDAAFQREFQPATANAGSLKLRCECARQDVLRVLDAPADQIGFAEARLAAGGPQILTAWWLTDDGRREQVSLQAWVEAVPQALGVKHAIPKGYVLQPADLVWVNATDGAASLTVLADIVGKETTRALRPGQPLQSPDLTAVPLVRSGDIVTVLVRRPGMVVRRQFKASTGGALQETVTLSALDDPRIKVQAVVTGYHEATIVGSVSEPRSMIQDATGVIQFVPATAEGAP